MPATVALTFGLPVAATTLHEPIWMDVSIMNGSPGRVRVDLGENRKGNFEVSVREPGGFGIRVTRLRTEGAHRIGTFTMAPGSEHALRLLLQEWYDFLRPAAYDVAVALVGGIATESGESIEPASGSVRIRVRPYDPERLRAVSAELARVAIQSSDLMERREATLALSYVRDSVAVPFLGDLVERRLPVALLAIDGLRRSSTVEAIAMLLRYARADAVEIASAARSSLDAVRDEVQDADLAARIDEVLSS